MTQDELGRALGVKKAAVQKIESGRTSIGVDKLMLICETFKVLPANILYGTFPTLWERVYGMKAVGDTPPYDEARRIAELEALAESRFGAKGLALLNDIDALNEHGFNRVIAYVGDVARIEDYRKSGQPN